MLERLRSARAESRMSQEQVAEALGVYRTFVTKCESGERRIDALELQMFAELYGRDLTHFVLDDAGDEPPPETFVFRRGDTLLSVTVAKEGRKVAVSVDTASPGAEGEGSPEGGQK